MSRKFLVNIDLSGNQLLSPIIHQNPGNPTLYSGANGGQIYFDTGTKNLYIHNGTTWAQISTGGTGGTGVTSFNSASGAINLLGTANQITVGAVSSGSITLSLPSTISGISANFTSASVNGNTVATTSNNLGVFASGGSISPATISTTGDITVGGSLYLTGSTTYVSASTLVVQDPLIYLGQNNPTNIWDLGFVGSFTSGTYQHTGLVRDHNVTNTWRLFSNAPEPANASVNFASVTYDTLALGGLTIYSSSTNVSASITSSGLLTAPSANFTSSLQLGGVSVARKYVGTITGTNAATSFPITHNLGTQDVVVQIIQTSAGPDVQWSEVFVDIVRTSTSVVTVSFATAPVNTTTYDVIVIG